MNERQLEVLKWVVDGCPDGRWEPGDYHYKKAAQALQNRRLVEVRKMSRTWTCTPTDAGLYYAQHGAYPDGHLLSAVTGRPVSKPENPKRSAGVQSAGRRPGRPEATPPKRPEPEWEIDSPRRLAQTGRSAQKNPGSDPWEDRLLVSVKHAAWLLDMSEATIRKAVLDGDMQRIWIGEGTQNYRIVYDSLLAWVDSMPREPRPTHFAHWDHNRRWL